MINWNNVLKNIESYRKRDITVDPSVWDLTNPDYKKMLTLWQDHNVNTASVKWTNYYIDAHIQDLFSEQVDCRPMRSWVSRIDPGYMTGWHWDIDEYEQLYKKQGNLVRYTCFIDSPRLGQTFIIEDKCYHNMKQGSIIKWDNYNDWHCGANSGLEPNYMFHLVGIDGSNL